MVKDYKNTSNNFQIKPSTSVCAFVRLPFMEIVLFFHIESPEQLYSNGPGICRFSEMILTTKLRRKKTCLRGFLIR